MFYLVYRICSSPLVLLPCLCLFMFPVNPEALKLENNWVTVSMSAVGAVQTFSQPGVPGYRILNVIGGSVYIGGNETLLKLSIAGNRVVPSAEITLVTGERPSTVSCAARNGDLAENVCWNFIRVVESISSGDLFVCGSNALTPVCYRCPMDLETSSTCMPLSSPPGMIGRFIPDFSSAIPSMALLASTSGDVLYAGHDYDIIDDGNFGKYRLSSIDIISQQFQLPEDPNFIKIPTFVGKPFEYTDGSGTEYVFFMFREVAVEYDSSEVKEFSRIARVCKNDTGGELNTANFVTYVKARLECSVSAPGVLPVYYDDVQNFIWDENNNEIYAVFTLSETAPPTSALCRYRIADIQTLFEGGDSKHQENDVNHLWVPVSLTNPTPGTVTSTSGDVLYAGHDYDIIDDGNFGKYRLSSIDIISQQFQLPEDPNFIKIPTFVGKPFEYTDGSGTEYVFFMFREVAVEYDSSEVKEFSRIARVCKNDTGGELNTANFVTYVKARLECSVSAPGVLPVYYDDVQNFIWDENNNEIYAVFTLSETAPPTSALCRYRIADIQTLFEGGDSKHQENDVNHLWVPVSLTNPTPGTCDEVHTVTYPPLMDKLVPNYNPTEPTTGFQVVPPSNLINSDTPTLIVDGVRFTSLAIDFDYGCLYFFGTSTGSVMKVHKTDCSDAAEQFTAVEINDLGTSGAITGLELFRNGTSKYLVITTDHTIITWPLTNNCTARSRLECETVRYPYCLWNGTECLCNASISDCENVATSDISTDLLQVKRDKSVTACYNHYVYWFCIIDSDDPFVQASGFNLTWSGPEIDNSLLVQTRAVSANVLELRVTVRTSTTGVFTCRANLGDGSSFTNDVELVQTVCETNDKILARCREHNSQKAQSEILQQQYTSANGQTCSVQTQDCNSCPP